MGENKLTIKVENRFGYFYVGDYKVTSMKLSPEALVDLKLDLPKLMNSVIDMFLEGLDDEDSKHIENISIGDIRRCFEDYFNIGKERK